MFFATLLLFLFGSSSSLRTGSLMLGTEASTTSPGPVFMLQTMSEEDSTILVDLIIDNIKDSIPDSHEFPNLSYSFSDLLNNSSYIGKLASLTGWISDLKSLHRASPVISSVSGNNLTISTTVSFGTLRANWPNSELLVLGVSMFGDTSVTFRQNEFAIKLTVFTDPNTGSCGIDVEKAGFSVLSAIDISIRPVGFFNQIHLDASVNHLSQAIFDELSYIDKPYLQSYLDKAICKAIPN